MLRTISSTSVHDNEHYLQNLKVIINNGSKAIFILISLGIGVAVPMLITRRETIKKKKTADNV